MPLALQRYHPVGPILLRASTNARTPITASLPETSPPYDRAWLAAQWAQPEVREAIGLASLSLAARVRQLLDDGEPSTRDVRRAVLATASYLARWQRRATPFGLFAGVTTVAVGDRTTVKINDGYQATARADADWLTRIIDHLEHHQGLRRHLRVVANNSGVVRDGRFIVTPRPQAGDRSPGPLREISTRHTRPVRLALAYTARPMRFDQLAALLAASLPPIGEARIDAMLHQLIDAGILITSLRPPMTAVDGLAHLVDALHTADADQLPEAAVVLDHLTEIHAQLANHNTTGDQQTQATIRAAVTESMTRLAPAAEHPLAVDVRLDAQVSIRQPVLDEAARAAGVLLRLTTQPFGSAAWLDYHTRFRDRYGPGTLVPVRDLVADSGLGYPAGFLGAPRPRPAWRMITERDVYLLALLQRAMLDGAEEICLSDADVEALTVGRPAAVVPPPRVELGVAVDTASAEALDRGEFRLWVTGAPRTPTSMAGRFAYLLDSDHLAQMTRTYAGTPDGSDAVAAQISFPPRRVHNENVVRVGRLLDDVVSLGEHLDGDTISVDDLAVTADADQLYLVRRSTGQPVIPHIPHALDVTVQTPPLARFIAEVDQARSAVFGPLDLGAAARTLPYTPRIRYRRTILAPARWWLTAADLHPGSGIDAIPTRAKPCHDEPGDQALAVWRQRWRVPPRIVACHGELRLPLDLDQPLDRALLGTRLVRAERLEIREDGPADGHGWLGRPAELLIALAATPPVVRRLPVTASPGPRLHPGHAAVLHARLVGNPARFDHLLTTHIPPLADALAGLGVRSWWVRRHRDLIRPDADQYLSVLLRLTDPDTYGPVAARLAAFVTRLHQRGLPTDLTLAAYHQHPARYGHGDALDAAEQVFAADTTAAIAQLRMVDQAGLPAQALAAASMAQLAAGFATDPTGGYRTLLTCLKQQAEPADRAVGVLARDLADPTGTFRTLRALPGGDAVADAWQARHHVLRTYHERLRAQRDPASVLRTLLHEHHIRAVGVDPAVERATNHAARAAAARCLARPAPR